MASILVVDDEKSIRITLSELLRDDGYEVKTVENAMAAVELMDKEEFDVVVTDIILPKISGVELLMTIRKALPRSPVIIMTGEPTLETASKALRAGAFDYLTKPISKDSVLKSIKNAVEAKFLNDDKLRLERENKEYRENLERMVEERIKELKCIYGVAESICKRETLEEIFMDVIALTPAGWQYPQITRARVLFEGKEYVSDSFEETEWKQSSDIVVGGIKCGVVEVYYTEERPTLDEGPFLKEERSLIDSIANSLSEAIKRKRAEEKLSKSEEKYRAVAENALTGIIIVDPNENIVYSNKSFMDMLLYSEDEILKTNLSQLTDGKEFKKYKEQTRRREKGEKDVYESFLYRKDGKRLEVLYSTSPMTGSDGSYIGALSVVNDITEFKKKREKPF